MSEPLRGQVLASRYRVGDRLGSGAMGTVYRCEHVKVKRPFALKVLHPGLLANPKHLKRFEREAELAGKLHHPNVIGVIDVGVTPEGLHYIVMEYAEGPTLGHIIDQCAPMQPRRVIDLVRQLCSGLQHAHDAGLIHRDFKPDNVIVEASPSGDYTVRILDFGIAIALEDAQLERDRLTTAGLVLGTPEYMAPEHAMGAPIDHRIDLFALGVIAYEMLTGVMPYDGSGVDVARANLMTPTPVMSVRVPGLEVDPLLEAFTRALMEKSPDARMPSAKAALDLLDLVATDRSTAASVLGVVLPDPAERRAPVVTAPPAPRRPELSSEALDQLLEGEPLPSRRPQMRSEAVVPVVIELPEPTAPATTAPARPTLISDAIEPFDMLVPLPHFSHPQPPSAASRPHLASQGGVRDPLGDLPAGFERMSTVPGGHTTTPIEPEPRPMTSPEEIVADARVAPTRRTRVRPGRRAAMIVGTAAAVIAIVAIVFVLLDRPRSSLAAVPPVVMPAVPPPVEPHPQPPAAAVPTSVATAAMRDVAPPAAPVDVPPAPPVATKPTAPATPALARPAPRIAEETPPKMPAEITNATISDLYRTVGWSLKKLDAQRGEEATHDLWPRYRHIRIADTFTSRAKLIATNDALRLLEKDISARTR